MHALVATYTSDAKSLCALPVLVPRAAAECRAPVILCSHAQWCGKFVQRAALPISLADRNWLKRLPWPFALYEVW